MPPRITFGLFVIRFFEWTRSAPRRNWRLDCFRDIDWRRMTTSKVEEQGVKNEKERNEYMVP